MMQFFKTTSIHTPYGYVSEILREGYSVWMEGYRYVSLGDSIAAGHSIDYNWETNYGVGSQYGENGHSETIIVPNCYTDLIHRNKATIHRHAYVTSFAHSGDTVGDLMSKLTHPVVRSAIAKAHAVTVCIGANDILGPAMNHLEEYINSGDLSQIESIVNTNMANLENDSYTNSYVALFDALSSINPDARFVFMTIYNPYKYLYIEEGVNGFFEPVLSVIPDMNLFGLDIDGLIKSGLLSTPIVQKLFSRVNGLSAWTETQVTHLNTILKNKVASYRDKNVNFYVADAKARFDTYPDRASGATVCYNDLVNVEYTRGYNTMTMDWGRLYRGDPAGYWTNLVMKYVSWSGLDIESMANELIAQTIERVIVPDIDPHPETYGQYVLSDVFGQQL